MEKLIGKDLSGWRIERWYQLNCPISEYQSRVEGYFKDKDIATAAGRKKGWYGCDCSVQEINVLTADGKTGHLLSKEISLENEEHLRAEAIKAAKASLTPEQIKILGIE